MPPKFGGNLKVKNTSAEKAILKLVAARNSYFSKPRFKFES